MPSIREVGVPVHARAITWSKERSDESILERLKAGLLLVWQRWSAALKKSPARSVPLGAGSTIERLGECHVRCQRDGGWTGDADAGLFRLWNRR